VLASRGAPRSSWLAVPADGCRHDDRGARRSVGVAARTDAHLHGECDVAVPCGHLGGHGDHVHLSADVGGLRVTAEAGTIGRRHRNAGASSAVTFRVEYGVVERPMPEGDTIHRTATRLREALAGEVVR